MDSKTGEETMNLIVSYSCDYCDSKNLEVVNGIIRCPKCLVSEKTINLKEKDKE